MTIRAFIVDDMPLARRKLRRCLSADPEIQVVGEASNGVQALEAVPAQRPDLMFLDVQLPDMDGVDLVKAIAARHRPLVVFMTAHDNAAVRAFEVHAVDYVLKPFTAARLRRAVMLARERFQHGSADSPAGSRHVSRLAAKSGDRTVIVKAADVDFFESEGNYVRLHTDGGSHLIRERLTVLEHRLSPGSFARIHRSIIVNLDRVGEMYPLAKDDLEVVFVNGKTLTLHRSYFGQLLSLIDDR